jgi:hypothetical protein
MQTVRHIERLWNARQYTKLFGELIANRPESIFRLELGTPTSTLAAAMGVIRLDELNQAHVPLYSTFIRALVASQEKDGGWGDATITTLCLRALMLGKGTGESIDQGLRYLGDLQKSDALWPKIPFRRMPGDACVSAFVLHQLADDERFRAAVRFDDAVNWFEAHEKTLEPEARRLWDRAKLRCGSRTVREPMLVWS